MKFPRFALPLALCLSAALMMGLSGCGGGSSSNSFSQVRFFNGMIGSGTALDFVQRSILVVGNVTFGEVLPNEFVNSSNNIFGNPWYQAVASGGNSATNSNQVTTQSYTTGGAGGDVGTPLASSSDLLDAHSTGNVNGTYTYIAYGVVGQSGNQAPGIKRLIDNPNLVTNAAVVRIVDLAPDSLGVNAIAINVNGAALNGNNGGGASNITYTNTSSLSGGAYLPVAISGAAPQFSILNQSNNVLIPALSGTLVAGGAYTIFVYGYVAPAAGQTGLKAVIYRDF